MNDAPQPAESLKQYKIMQVDLDQANQRLDKLTVEEPLEIRAVFGPQEKRTGRSLSITMRTPDYDFDLAAGFLFTEGIIQSADDILGFEFCGSIAEGRKSPNIVRVNLAYDTTLDMQLLQRHFYTTSSCGICGKASLEALHNQNLQPLESTWSVASEMIRILPSKLRDHQSVFEQTGGIHAAGLYGLDGATICVREDVGRHNALDKLIGHQLRIDSVPLAQSVLVVSGRASFELMQKALVASIPMLVAVGAPSSLAVDLARQFNTTLVGFAGIERFNVYSAADRISFA